MISKIGRPRPVLMVIPSLVAIHSLVLEKNADKQTNKLFSNFSMISQEKVNLN